MSSFSYAVFSYVIPGRNLPVGIALWSTEERFARIRLAPRDEKLKGVGTKAATGIDIVSRQLAQWLKEERLPYSEFSMMPWSNEWWLHVQRLLIHAVQLSDPYAIDCHDPEKTLGTLYEAVIDPHRAKSARERLESAITTSLGGALSDRFQARATIQGYGNRGVRVDRVYQGTRAIVVVEGLNLIDKADSNSDETCGKIMRLISGEYARKAYVLVPYLTGPHGLNGETPLVKFLETFTHARLFDVKREATALHEAVEKCIDIADGNLSLPLDQDDQR